jgi:hypothetical protein
VNHAMWSTVAHAFRRVGLPLVWYYGVTVAIPLANGASPSDAVFVKHALVVLVLPPVLIVVACAAHHIARGLLGLLRHRHLDRRPDCRAVMRTRLSP